MSYLETLQAALAANAERVAKPICVDVPNVGKIYVRPRLVSEYEAAEQAVKDGDANAIAAGAAKILCDENGNRFPPEIRDGLAKLLAEQPQSILIAIDSAADGKAGN